MGMIFGFVFFSLIISEGLLLPVQASVYSTPDTALRFSKCLIEKMSESQIFSEEDRNNMVEVANVMSEALLSQQTKLPPKILLTAFITSMTDVISHEDVEKNANRKGFYSEALERCSLSTTGYIDSEFIELCLGILSSIENMKFFGSDDAAAKVPNTFEKSANAEESIVFNPSAVQPSPVQNPHIPGNFDADVTDLKPVADRYPISTDSLSNVQPASNIGMSSAADARGVYRQEVPVLAAPMASRASVNNQFEVASSFGGLKVPQTKESTIVVIPPAESKQPVPNYPLPLQPGDTILNPTNVDNMPLPHDTIPASSLTQADVQDQNVPSTFALDDIILNTLIESSIFRNTFNFETSPEYAISLARSITEKSLEGYNSDVITEALTAVSDEIAKVSFHTPENYALALSVALVRVMKLHNLPLFIDGSKIATSLVSNLENTQELSSQAKHFDDPLGELSHDVVYTDWSKKEVDFDFETPPLAPEDTEGEIFSEVFAQYLSESDKLSEFFCDSDAPESKMKIYFTIIKSSLARYSHRVSSLAASLASSALAELPKEELCSNFAKTISEVIAEVLDENGVLQGANAEAIAKQMELYLIQLNVSQVPQKTESSVDNLEHNETTDVVPVLQSSFSSNFGNVNATPNNFKQSSVEYVSYEDKNYRTPDYFPSDTTSHSFSASSSSIPIPSKSDQEVSGYTSPITIPYTTEITDEVFTSATPLVEIISSITEASPTESSWDWAPGGVINQEELASYILGELESVLEDYYNKESEPKGSSSSTDDDLSRDEVAKHTVLSDVLRPTSPQSEGNAQNDKVAQPITDGNRRNSHLQRETDILTERKNVPPDFVSGGNSKKTETGFSVKKELVELEPSFQDPQLLSEYLTRSVVPSTSAYATASNDFTFSVAKAMSQIATSSIAYIHSGNFDINNLCARINQFAPIVNIPPLVYCQETAAIDYLLNVLNSAVKILMKV